MFCSFRVLYKYAGLQQKMEMPQNSSELMQGYNVCHKKKQAENQGVYNRSYAK